MNYNDFPILNDLEYNFLNKQFSTIEFNRKDVLTKISYELNSIVNTNLGSKEKFNNKIKQELKNAIETSNKWLNNFSSQFNLTIKNLEISNLNIFSMLKKLNTTISFLLVLVKNETKEYYKTLAINCANELILSSSNILQALNESNLILFKHM